MHAVDNLSDAIDVTREFLTPARPGLWLRLAVIVLFVGSLGFSGPSVPMGDVGMVTGEGSVDDFQNAWAEFEAEFEAETGETIPVEELIAAAVFLLLLGGVIWLVWSAIRSVMEFVFIESLRSSEVHVRRYFGQYLGSGARLLGFRLALLALTTTIVFVPGYLIYASAGSLGALAGTDLLTILLVAGLGWLVYSIVWRFTTEFVAPVMVLDGRGVLSAWRRTGSAIRANLAEYLVYLILVWILGFVVTIAASIVIAIVVFVAVIVMAIPIVLLGIGLFAILGDLAVLPVGLLTLVAVVVLLVLVVLVWVPIETYFKYYALLLLGDTDSDLDLIPDQRAAVRGDGGLDGPNDGIPSTGEGGWSSDDDRSITDDRSTDDARSVGDDGRSSADDATGFDWGRTEDTAEGDDDSSGWETDRDDESTDDEDDGRGW